MLNILANNPFVDEWSKLYPCIILGVLRIGLLLECILSVDRVHTSLDVAMSPSSPNHCGTNKVETAMIDLLSAFYTKRLEVML